MLHRACRSGDLNEVTKALDSNISSINDKDAGLGWTALYRAVICDQLEICETLLKSGADPNIPNNLGQVPLHSASESGQYSIATLLVSCKSNSNAQTISGDTPLHYAAYKGDSMIVRLLLEHNANPNAQNAVKNIQLGRTPLHSAVESGSIDCIKLLREFGADSEICDNNMQKPLDLTADFRISEVLLDCKIENLTNKSEDISEIESPPMYELFNTFGSNLHSIIRESSEKPLLMDWLSGISLADLYATLVDSGYDDHVVMARQMLTSMPITENNLIEIGIKKPGSRRMLLFYLEEEGKTKNYTKRENSTISAQTVRDWLYDLEMIDYHKNFIDAGYDNYSTLVKMVPTRWGLSESILRTDLLIFEEHDIRRILHKLQRDYINSRNEGPITYEEPRSVPCSRCNII